MTRDSSMPNGIHIAIVVFGPVYTALLTQITLANLAALVREIPDDLRELSRVRIMTTATDACTIEQARTLKLLREHIDVEVLDRAKLHGHDTHGDYGPMVVSQRLLVVEAMRADAALFFIGPDLILNKGAFAALVSRFREGYRLVIGPGPRINRRTAVAELKNRIAESPDGAFALAPREHAALLFRHWHCVNSQYLIESPSSYWWKAYVCYRPRPEELLFRSFQGPTFAAWPARIDENFNGFIDHQLAAVCCESWRQIYIIPDSDECLALDLTEDDRRDMLPPADLLAPFLLSQLFDHAAIKDMYLRCGVRACRVHSGESDSQSVAAWQREFDRVVDPLVVIALGERSVGRHAGPMVAKIYRTLCLWSTHTLLFVLGPIASRMVHKWKVSAPLNSGPISQ
ncbi:hypothetical protein [Bradyrhizobium sp.]|uniref:hypothetical protein n=1 Tax=Bradyrhizobium sp. TaxID=376 RepID=UPI003C36684A